MMHRLTALALATLLIGAPDAPAQPIEVELSSAQLELNETGVQAIREGDYAEAIQLLNASLSLGEANITYLNLGRALTRDGQCYEASQSLRRVLTAPRIASVDVAQLLAVRDDYLSDLFLVCGEVQLTCADRLADISVNGSDFAPCHEEPIALRPGAHIITARTPNRSRDFEFDLTAEAELALTIEFPTEGTLDLTCAEPGVEYQIDGEGDFLPCPHTTPERLTLPLGEHTFVARSGARSVERSVTIDADTEARLRVELPPPPAPPMSALGVAGWSLTGVGAAALITSIVLEAAVLSPDADALRDASERQDVDAFRALQGDFDTLQTTNQILVISGGLLAASGLTLLVLDWTDALDSGPETGVSLRLIPSGSGASLRLTW